MCVMFMKQLQQLLLQANISNKIAYIYLSI